MVSAGSIKAWNFIKEASNDNSGCLAIVKSFITVNRFSPEKVSTRRISIASVVRMMGTVDNSMGYFSTECCSAQCLLLISQY